MRRGTFLTIANSTAYWNEKVSSFLLYMYERPSRPHVIGDTDREMAEALIWLGTRVLSADHGGDVE